MAFVSASRTGANWFGPVSVTRPAGAVEGTLLIHVAYAYGTSGANTLTPPSGFTTAQSYSAGFDSAVRVAYKVMGASEPSTYNWSASVGTTGWVAQIVYDTTTTVADSAGAKDAGGASTATAPSVPGGLAGATLVTIIAGWEAGKAPYTAPSGMTERLDEADASNGGSIGVFDQGLATNGATGTRVAGSTGTQPAYGVNLVLSGGSGDIEAPTITGPITVTGRTSTGYTLGGWSASDNVAVTGYERSLDGGSTWSDIGLVTSSTVTGRTPGSTDAVRVRAYDAAGNRSTPLTASVTLRYGGVTGATIVAQTATGDDGPGALYDSMRPPATDARIYEFDVITAPAAGTFTIYNNASFSLVGAPDGVYSLVLRVWEDGVQLSPDLAHTITVGTPATLATGSASGAWSVRNLIPTSRGGAWSVRNLATTTTSGAWSVRNLAAGSAAGAWSVRASVSTTKAGAWSVRNTVTGSAAGAWSVAASATIVSTTLDGAWSVRTLAASSQAGAWSVRNLTSTTRAGAWSVRNLAAGSAASAWSVRNLASTSAGGAWSVRNLSAATATGAWSVRAAVGSSVTGAWSVRNLAAGSVGAAWSVRNRVAGSKAGAWSVLSAGGYPDPADVRYGVQYGPTGTEYTGTLRGTGVVLIRRR